MKVVWGSKKKAYDGGKDACGGGGGGWGGGGWGGCFRKRGRIRSRSFLKHFSLGGHGGRVTTGGGGDHI